MTLQPSANPLELDRDLTLIALEVKTAPGKDVLLARRPLVSLEACEDAQADLAEMARFFLSEGLLPLAGVIDVAPLFARESVLELDESWLVVRAARATQAIRETLLRIDGYARLGR